MKDDCCTGSAIAGMLFFFSLFLGLTFAIYPGWEVVGKFLDENLLLSKEAPAWVQAIGSVCAIYFAATSARNHYDSSLKIKSVENLENIKNMTDTCQEISRGLVSVSLKLHQLACKGEEVRFERINDLQETLRILLSKSMPVELLSSLFKLQKILAEYKENMMIAISNDASDDENDRMASYIIYMKHRTALRKNASSVRIYLQNYKRSIEEKMD